MTNTATLYQELQALLNRGQWPDQRLLKTAVNMVIGIMLASTISVTSWRPYVQGRARQAQSVQRRFGRWLSNRRLDARALYTPLIQEALRAWGCQPLYLALDTTMLWDRYCMIRLSVVYRGRAIPLDWQVLEHGSAQVALAEYQGLLERAAAWLATRRHRVVLLADRGFADTELMRLCQRLKWGYRIRIKSTFLVERRGRQPVAVEQLLPKRLGQAVFFHAVHLTAERLGPVHLALARPDNDDDPWLMVSSELTGLQTFAEYGLRFDIEEEFLDDKSNGFQLEASKLRCAHKIERLFFGIAVATLYLVVQGSELVEQGRRREVDPHWFRGSSYLKIGWQWFKQAVHQGGRLFRRWRLVGDEDPDPAWASRRQHQKTQQRKPDRILKVLYYGL